MQSRRDQVLAHRFVLSRLNSGMLRTDPDSPDTPMGRTSRGGLGGLAIGIAIGLVVALYGVIMPGGATSWQKPGVLVVVKETGARFLYYGGMLHPVLNEASAKLLAGSQMTVQQVGLSSLGSAPRGAPIGIAGAPDALPDQAALSRGPWLACSTGPSPGSVPSVPQTTLVVGFASSGRPVGPNEAVFVSTARGGRYLIWQGRRLQLDVTDGAVQALGYDTATPVPVPDTFLDAIPAGPDLTSMKVDGRGTPGPVLAGAPTRLGQLFTSSGNEHYLLRSDGLVPLSDTGFQLVRGDPRTQQAAYAGGTVTPAQIGPADLAAHRVSGGSTSVDSALPSSPPTVLPVTDRQAICVRTQPTDGAPSTSVIVLDTASIAGQAPASQPGVQLSCRPADQISVRPGSGALVRAVSGGGAESTVYLVTDAGVKYPSPSDAASTQLGYDTSTAVRLPSTLLGLLPTGPSLDPAALANGGVVAPPGSTGNCGS